MGTNYYRIPKSPEMVERHQKLVDRVSRLDVWNPSLTSRNFADIEGEGFDMLTPWDEFTKEINIHLGKRSGGWKFCWNFHNNKYYSSKEQLLKFIRSGRVVDEYGQLQDTEEFIKMALEWDGIIADEEYFKKSDKPTWFNWRDHVDKVVDGLRVSSSVDFC